MSALRASLMVEVLCDREGCDTVFVLPFSVEDYVLCVAWMESNLNDRDELREFVERCGFANYLELVGVNVSSSEKMVDNLLRLNYCPTCQAEFGLPPFEIRERDDD